MHDHDPHKPHPLWSKERPPIILGRPVLQRLSPADFPIRVDPVFGCWLWTGPTTGGGYPGLRTSGDFVLAHRHLFELVFGPIPDGYVADHTCRRRSCTRPIHLEAVTKGENESRKRWGRRVKRQECPRGHDMRINSAITPEGGRTCRTCNRGNEDRL